MTYNVSMGTLNPTIPYHTIPFIYLFIYYAKWQHKYIYGKIRKKKHSYNTNFKKNIKNIKQHYTLYVWNNCG